MFTGIITDLGAVRAVETGGDTRFVFDTGYDTDGIAIGASIACSGVCLTVVDKGPGWFAVQASGETLARTTLGAWGPGQAVNFERALTLGGELGGHFVFGHVDGVATIAGRAAEGDSLRLLIEAPQPLMRFVAPKGCAALDGVSLTVNEVEGTRFGVNVIPHTRRSTTLGAVQPGDRVNLEVDMLARYVERLLQAGVGE
jgi:riboflavin synthase